MSKIFKPFVSLGTFWFLALLLQPAFAQFDNGNSSTGYQSFNTTATGGYNSAYGQYVLMSTTPGAYNTAAGYEALKLNTTGNYNTAVGGRTLQANTASANIVSTVSRAGVRIMLSRGSL